jgi:endonuclease/exonuclease/phosphatase family metal-dependent hydrolase
MKIVCYNIHMGLETEAIVKNIKDFAAQGVEVFCFQEFWKWMQPADLEVLLLAALGPDWQMEYVTPEPPLHDFGQCILWKKSVLEPVSFEQLPLPLLPKAKRWEKAWISWLGFDTYIVQRGALVGTFNWNNKRLRITVMHLDWQGSFKQRAAQLTYIKDYLAAQEAADFEIVCGDFNTLGVFNKAKQMERIANILGSEFSNTCSVMGETCRPLLHLDHIFVKNFRVNDFQIYKIPGSDHFPLFADLAI